VPLLPPLDLAGEKALEKLHRQVAIWQVPHVLQKLVREDGDLRLFEARGREDVYHLVRNDRPRDDLPDGRFYVFPWAPTAFGLRAFEDRRPHGLEEGHLVADTRRIVVRSGERKCVR